ncbi:MAG: pilus assembly protein [Chloroflexota bacterium]|nr:MAG: pilus assembly protein [Chloroflexota bacterium]
MSGFIRDRRGVATIELTFAVVILSMLLFGALELSRAYSVKHALGTGAYQAARYLSYNPTDHARAETIVRDEVRMSLGGGLADQVSIAVAMPSGNFQSVFTVEATVHYVPLTPVPFVSLGSRTLVGRHSQTIERYP